MATEDGIRLVRMEPLTEAVSVDDIWTGKTDPAARRKRQNRLNQRAYRKRKLLEIEANDSALVVYANTHPASFRYQLIDQGQLGFCRPPSAGRSSPMIPYASGDSPVVVFPLPLDHLLTLVQFNVLRAIVTNMTIVPIVQLIPFECRAVLNIPPSALVSIAPLGSIVPSNFTHTKMQREILHEPWIDMLPSPRFRDNMIVAMQNPDFDEDSWHVDIVGGLWEGYDDVEMKGIVAWSDPWSPAGWEVSEGFLEKWGFLLIGCEDMLVATNKWRALRGEEALIWEL